jgi:hypothetical protein
MEPEITAKVKRSGHEIFEIPIRYFPRPPGQGGKKLSARKDGLPALMALLRYRFWKPPPGALEAHLRRVGSAPPPLPGTPPQSFA